MLKKILSSIAVVGALALPLVANADIVTVNNTNLYASMKMENGTFAGTCIPQSPYIQDADSKWTGPEQRSLPTSSLDVGILCGTDLYHCKASMYVSDKKADVMHCGGQYAGTATISSTSSFSSVSKKSFTYHKQGSPLDGQVVHFEIAGNTLTMS